jgi:hypothetical protein
MKKFYAALIFLLIFAGGVIFSGSAQATSSSGHIVSTQVCKIVKKKVVVHGVKKTIKRNTCRLV